MIEFLKDTKDLLEKKYGNLVLKNYPKYAEIWEEIIGVREVNGQFLPYEIDFSRCTLTQSNQDKFKRIHEQVCMAVYSQFCHLVGAHYQYSEAKKSMTIKDDSEKYFKFWESFDNFYQHIGVVRFQLFHIRNCFNCLGVTNIQKNKEDFERYFNTKTNNLGTKWIKIEEEFTSIRNYIVHFSRIPSIGNEIFGIPFVIPETKDVQIMNKPIWSDSLSKKETHIDALIQMKKIIKEVEAVLNRINSHFLNDFSDYIKKYSITFKRQIK